ncbi:MAG TPA: choice-of-anchor D domain-containing protein [Polyangiaceae bacterium]|nr:choice-of-anchor D domain-containing protein [Polyangiaceae bacterium]
MRFGIRWTTSAVMLCAAPLLAAQCEEPSLALADEEGNYPDGDFSGIVIGTSTTETYTLTNSGGSDALLRYVILEGGRPFGPFSLGGTCQTNGVIPANGGSCTLVVGFAPTSEYAESVNLRVNYYWEGAAFYKDLAVYLTGSGALATPTGISDGPAYDYGELLAGSSARKTFQFTNNSSVYGATLGVISARGLGLNAPFSFVEGTCATEGFVYPGASCSLTVAFSPAAAGEFSDSIDLQFRSQSTERVQVVSRPISGAGYTD